MCAYAGGTCEAAIAERRLVVNADDFGLSDGVTRGILEAHRAGAVNAASMCANTPGFASAVRAARTAPNLELGLHFNITVGMPVSRPADVATLCNPSGRFWPFGALIRRALAGRIDPNHVARECLAQLERLRAHGIVVTHVDGHRHVQVLPGVWPAVARIAAEEGLPLRVPAEPLRGGRALPKLALRAVWSLSGRNLRTRFPRHFRGIGLLGTWRFAESFLRILEDLPPGGTEIMVHPGYADADLLKWDEYGQERERELEALRSPRVLKHLAREDHRLVRFADL